MSTSRFTPASFGPLEARPLHLDLTFGVEDTRVTVVCQTTFVNASGKALERLVLNAKALEVKAVETVAAAVPLTGNTGAYVEHVASFGARSPAEFSTDTDAHTLTVTLSPPVSPDAEFVVRTVTVATPTRHILEGLYFDYTPTGAPPTIITQCQQYGFQRIAPCIDRMIAKAAFTTTIVAAARYTNLMSNGDLAPGFVADDNTAMHKPVTPELVDAAVLLPDESHRVVVRWHFHITPMSTYLFFLGCGTYTVFRRELEYPRGKACTLELVCFPDKVRPEDAAVALTSLHDSVMWIHVCTGPEGGEHPAEEAEILTLVKEREALKEQLLGTLVTVAGKPRPPAPAATPDTPAAMERLAAVRGRLATLSKAWAATGHEYCNRCYREIAMENSDFGGMENATATTVLASVLTPSPYLTDDGFVYMVGVKAHEFYHDLNGSRVTGDNPFSIWLNEAVTVHIERKRVAAVFDPDFMRLRHVLYAHRPAVGPLAQDVGALAMAIEPASFVRPQELISAMTYSKAPEFVRMIELLLGKPTFNKGLHLYHTRYAHTNASPSDWVAAMEEVSGLELKGMARGWLKRSGHPHVVVASEYDADSSKYVTRLTQSGYPEDDDTGAGVAGAGAGAGAGGDGVVMGPWMFPIEWALVMDGAVTHRGVWVLKTQHDTFTVEGVTSKPDFLSFSVGWSFFGTFSKEGVTSEELVAQALFDPDAVNRNAAFRVLANNEKVAAVKALLSGDTSHTVSATYVNTFSRLLFDEGIGPAARALILSEAEALEGHTDLACHYWEVSKARHALYQAVFAAHSAAIMERLTALLAASKPGPQEDQLGDRALTRLLVAVVVSGAARDAVFPVAAGAATAPAVDVPALALQLLRSPFMSNRVAGLRTYLELPSVTVADREAVLAEVRAEWSRDAIATEAFLTTLATVDNDAAPATVAGLLSDPLFNVSLAGHARSLARAWGSQRKRAILSDDGLATTEKLLVDIGRVNQMSASALVAAFSDLAHFDKDTQDKLLAALARCRDAFDPKGQPSLHSRLSTLLAEHGK